MRRDGCALRLAIVVLSIIVLAALMVAFALSAMTALEALTPSVEAAEPLQKSSVSAAEAAKKQHAAAPVKNLSEPVSTPDEPEDPEDLENALIEEALLARSHKIENCKITYYCCEKYAHICGTGDGLTALGGEVTPGVSCAVPKGIPLGSTIMIDWGDGSPLEYRRGDDRGDAVRGDHIDLAVPSHREALELGVRRATVYWTEEEL